MTLLEYLREAAKSQTTTHATFLQQYSKNDNAIHVFHEGKDDPSFYGNFVENKKKTTQKIYYYRAKNKDSVYENYQKINWSAYSKTRVVFLVDKDFSDFLDHKYPKDANIFVTSFYSIENYLVDKQTFSRAIREIVSLADDKANHLITRQFSKGLITFYEASKLLAAYFIFHRRNNNPINLGSLKLTDMFTIDSSFVVKRKPRVLAELDRKTGVVTQNAFKEIRGILSEINLIENPKIYVRGKYEVGYLAHCITQTPNLLNQGKNKGEPHYKCSVPIAASNAIQILAPRIKQPNDVKTFFASTIHKK